MSPVVGGWKMCRPCLKVQNLTHMDCTDPYGKLGLCQCWVTSWVHCTKFRIPEYGDFERDGDHDTGEDEFDWQESRRGLSIEPEMED
ncbi:hypothetical protein LCGC14_1278320 [marine sediment metagenome]|uniref:Uncharacterized protein n=1 Tax=marine sediment metagenome TaxID=412755 RepID=A0A0F9KVZ1_9ZZZZ